MLSGGFARLPSLNAPPAPWLEPLWGGKYRLFPMLETILRELEAAGPAHDAAEPERRRKRLNLERETAQLLQLLILHGRCRRVLEIGTSNGVSALWIADAVRRIPSAAPLVTIEREAEKAGEARANIARAGLSDWVDLRVGDATTTIATLPGPFDAVFFDADRVSAPDQLRLLLPKLAPDTLLLADNALSHPEEIAGYLAAVTVLPDFTTMTIPVGKGLHVACRVAAPVF